MFLFLVFIYFFFTLQNVWVRKESLSVIYVQQKERLKSQV